MTASYGCRASIFEVTTMPKITLSREEVADALSVDVQTIDRMIKAKELRASKLRRRVVIRVADIERLLDANAVVA
jgi:excisionase family DNA binding protein